MKKGEFCCIGMKQKVERGLVQHKKIAADGDRLFFVVKTIVPTEDGKDTVGIVLQKCFICGLEIYPR